MTDREVGGYPSSAVPFVRWLVSLLAVLTLVGQPLSAFASAGEKTDIRCCCPDPDTCACHDHDGGDSETMKRCAGAEHEVLPVLAVATLAVALGDSDVPRAARAVEHRDVPIPDSPTHELETPPF